MSRTGEFILDAIRRLGGFLFICLMLIGIFLLKKAPWLSLGMAALMLVGGVFLLVYGLKTMQRYKDVFDYMPTEFRGKPRNGKQVRDYLMGLNVIGLWCALAGLALLLLALNKGPVLLVDFW